AFLSVISEIAAISIAILSRSDFQGKSAPPVQGHSRRSYDVRVTSAYPPKATEERTLREVRNVPT
ncbi:MAG TPA: hypothetical protein VNZ53_51140, partial [Steroidobacteraceae bacterium]|nr:hypothetical protein [Steroidobacteraceae bacterium]